MRTKSKLIAMMSGLTLAFTGVAGSYAYFNVEKTSSENKISIGKLPKAKVKIFASTGPLSANLDYNNWLDNTSNYISNNMIDNGTNKSNFENLSNGSTVDVKSNIGNNTVRYVIAIFNETNKGEESGRKLNYKNENVKIERYDNFKGESGKTYKLRKEENISLNGKEERIRTFDFDGSKFVQDGEHGKPSEDADLILFDVGGMEYTANGTEQKDLEQLNNTLIGEQSLFDENNNILWQSNNPLHSLATQMNGIDKKAKLLNSICNVSFKYSDDSSYVVSENYSINRTGSIMGNIEKEKPKDEIKDNNESSKENVKPQEVIKPQENIDNKDKEENKKPTEETKPTVPENNVKPETPNNGGENQKSEIPNNNGTIEKSEENKKTEEELKDKTQNQSGVIEEELEKNNFLN